MQLEISAFFNKLEQIYDSKSPFVVYRKPNEKRVTVRVQNTSDLIELKSFKEVGFVFSPFNKNEKKILFPLNNSEIFSHTFQNFDDLTISSKKSDVEDFSDVAASKEQHIALVEKSIKEIQQKKAAKIVVSRKEKIKSTNFDVLNSYKKMLKNYQNATVYLWFHPKVGCWMGASPERLIHLCKGKFKTMSLAGTQNYIDSLNVVWKTKEQQEQQFVTDYILETIKGTISNKKVSNPYTVKAGSLVHLRTDISGSLEGENSLGELVNSLHPTPAVCGLPKNMATDFINQNEGYDRTFYAGYFGELNINSETNLFVNLRCMEIKDDLISIYVGGGITAESNAEKEWNETVSKAVIMKRAL